MQKKMNRHLLNQNRIYIYNHSLRSQTVKSLKPLRMECVKKPTIVEGGILWTNDVQRKIKKHDGPEIERKIDMTGIWMTWMTWLWICSFLQMLWTYLDDSDAKFSEPLRPTSPVGWPGGETHPSLAPFARASRRCHPPLEQAGVACLHSLSPSQSLTRWIAPVVKRPGLREGGVIFEWLVKWLMSGPPGGLWAKVWVGHYSFLSLEKRRLAFEKKGFWRKFLDKYKQKQKYLCNLWIWFGLRQEKRRWKMSTVAGLGTATGRAPFRTWRSFPSFNLIQFNLLKLNLKLKLKWWTTSCSNFAIFCCL